MVLLGGSEFLFMIVTFFIMLVGFGVNKSSSFSISMLFGSAVVVCLCCVVLLVIAVVACESCAAVVALELIPGVWLICRLAC